MWLRFAVLRCDCCHQSGTGAKGQGLLPGVQAGPCSQGLSHCPSQGAGQVAGWGWRAACCLHSSAGVCGGDRAMAWLESPYLI